MKKIILSVCSLMIFLYIYPQGEIILSSPRSTGGTETACQSIILRPGFIFTSSSGRSLSLQVNPSTCDPYSGSSFKLPESQNYIHTRTYTQAGGGRYLDVIQYFDGLGRPIQTAQRGITPFTKDLVTQQEYDGFGRESYIWLPAAISGNNGNFIATKSVVESASRQTNVNGTTADQRPYSYPEYESSPLSRVIKQYGPGQEWNNAPIKTDYLSNNSSYPCAKFTTTDSRETISITRSGVYADGELYVTRMTDESGNAAYEFKDKLGQVLLTRQMNGSTPHDTYYIYDSYGNLRAVLPPEASAQFISGIWYESNTYLRNYAFVYKYDTRNRCIAKKIPGADWIYMVYDKADRLILSQDGEQRTGGRNQWSFTKYDAFGRIILTGIHVINKTHAQLRSTYENTVVKESPGDGSYGYTWNTLSDISYVGVLTVNHYDDYDHLLSQESRFRANLSYTARGGYDTRHINSSLGQKTPKGLLTGTRVKVIDNNGNVSSEIITALYYDYKGQVIQSKSLNHMGGTEEEYTAYNFTGQPTSTLHIHSVPGKAAQTELYTYSYDHAGRNIEVKHQLNGGAETVLAQNTYDELGRLKTTTANGP